MVQGQQPTGDLQNNIDRLRAELQQAKYPGPIEARAWRRGNAADLLPLVHFALLGYSKLVHDMILAQGYDLFAKTDMRFLEAVYKVL
ncbi:Centrosomal CEP44 domain-containing protein [Baffinella frigidus]|nr:Centrosomal CEP44 domain-containing protein [Cryptophyta sp. CCMP2293]